MSLQDRIEQERGRYGQSRDSKLITANSRAYPQTAEPAMVHPKTKSIVKMRDSGAIDVFVGNDNGIRVDPNSRSVKTIANHEHSMVGSITRSVGRSHSTSVGGPWKVGSSNFNTSIVNDAAILKMQADIKKLQQDVAKLQKDLAESVSALTAKDKSLIDADSLLASSIARVGTDVSAVSEDVSALAERVAAVESKV